PCANKGLTPRARRWERCPGQLGPKGRGWRAGVPCTAILLEALEFVLLLQGDPPALNEQVGQVYLAFLRPGGAILDELGSIDQVQLEGADREQEVRIGVHDRPRSPLGCQRFRSL